MCGQVYKDQQERKRLAANGELPVEQQGAVKSEDDVRVQMGFIAGRC